jgi:ribosomal protein L7/L12
MNDQELSRYITSLQARMNRMETLMRQLLNMLSTGASTGEQTQIQNILQQLHDNPEISLQERPELGAIREALLSGDKLKAIKLYRSVYGVGLKEAQDALDAL